MPGRVSSFKKECFTRVSQKGVTQTCPKGDIEECHPVTSPGSYFHNPHMSWRVFGLGFAGEPNSTRLPSDYLTWQYDAVFRSNCFINSRCWSPPQIFSDKTAGTELLKNSQSQMICKQTYSWAKQPKPRASKRLQVTGGSKRLQL